MCGHCKGISRRGFLEVLSAGAVAASAAPMVGSAWAAGVPRLGPPKTKIRVAKLYLGRAKAGWPKPNLDVPAEIKRFEAELAKLAPQLADIEFVGGDLVGSAADVAAVREKIKDVAGVLAIHVNMGVGGAIKALLDLKLPVMMFAIPYAGHEWHTIATMQREGKLIEILPSSNFADLAVAVRPLRAIQRLKEAKVLYIRDPGPDPKYVEAIRAKFGTEIKKIAGQELIDTYQSIPLADAAALADDWVRRAEKVIEPPKDDIVKGARMDLALCKLVEREQAAAITINCLGMGLIDRDMGYPCLGFCHLNDIGLGGVCEADLKSTMTHLIFLNLVGKPGFVTDPVIDLSNNTIIHAHCVAATKMDGPAGPSAPFTIRNHLEDHRGCVLQVKMRKGEKISMARLIGDDIMLFSTGEIVDVPDVDRGCRTKITTKVSNAQRFLDNWSCGLHRVVFYGEHAQDIRRFCRFKQIRLLQEGVDDLHDVPGLEWTPTVRA